MNYDGGYGENESAGGYGQSQSHSHGHGHRGGGRGAWQGNYNNGGGRGQAHGGGYRDPPPPTSFYSSQPQQDDQDQDHDQEQQDESANRRNLIINYLPQHLTDRDLYDLFSPFGNIENARVMKDRKTGYSFGYGFVNYSQENEATEAIREMNMKKIDNKTLKVSLARPSSEEIKDTNLYVSNLRRDITFEDLKVMFSPFGEIVHQNILQDKYTGLPRGVAFVRFARREQANAALEAMNNFTPDGCTEALRVKIAENHGKQKAAYVAGFQAGFYQGGPSRFYE